MTSEASTASPEADTSPDAWIKNNIKRRKCLRFVLKPTSSESNLPWPVYQPWVHWVMMFELEDTDCFNEFSLVSFACFFAYTFKESDVSKKFCCCGYSKDQHFVDVQTSDSHPWNAETDTGTYATNAFGEIKFPGSGDKVSKYVRIDYKTEISTMKTLFEKAFGLTMPNLVISVTGGALSLSMNPRLKEVFQRGLMKAALTTGAWIVTGGTNTGVMRHVGEAVRDFEHSAKLPRKVACIGIATWGFIHDKEKLISGECQAQGTEAEEKTVVYEGKWPAFYHATKSPESEQSCLDPNHTHFILVDDGTQSHHGVEINFRSELEKMIATWTEEMNTDSGVPVVQLVLGGGPGTLDTCRSAIEKGTPIVIIKGTGRAAEILAFAYQHLKTEDVEVNVSPTRSLRMDEEVENKIKEMIREEFGVENIDKHLLLIKKCVKKRHLMTVFELDNNDSTQEVDMALLKALLKAKSSSMIDHLKFALVWNRTDIAKSDIFVDNKEWNIDELEEVMKMAIQLDRVDFVDLLVDHGVNLKSFLTRERIESLYNETSRGYAFRSLLDKALHVSDSEHVCVKVIDRLMTRVFYTPTEQTGEGGRKPIQELFIWSVLMNRQKLAKLFWREGNEQIAAALVASNILKTLKQHTDDTELIRKLQEDAEEFEELAVGVLNSCYKSDEKKAQYLVIRELKNWGKARPIFIASQADDKKFTSHIACQTFLSNIWMGNMSTENGIAKIVLGILIFPFVWLLIRFRGDEDKIKQSKPTHCDHHEHGPESKSLLKGLQTDSKKHHSTSSHKINLFKKLYYFYTSPITIFSLNVMFYLMFLTIYSYILLIEFKPKFSIWEGVLVGWVFTLTCEEVRQVLNNSTTSLRFKLRMYFKDLWNILDVITILLFIIGLFLRFIPNQTCFEAARVVFCINLLSFFLRLLHIFSVSKHMGPTLAMIHGMMEQLVFFVLILMVFVVAYAIATEAIMFPNQRVSWSLLYSLSKKAYWTIYGELFLEDIEGTDSCTNNQLFSSNGTMLSPSVAATRCPTQVGRYLVPILMGVYVLLTNVLLLNLLIAMFSYAVQHIQENTEMYWYFQRFQLIIEYHCRPALPPPLIIISHFYLLCKYCLCRCRAIRSNTESVDLWNRYDTRYEERPMLNWEKLNAIRYLIETEEKNKETVEHRVQEALVRLDDISSKMDVIQEDVTNRVTLSDTNDSGQDQLVHTHQALNWIMKAMSKSFPQVTEVMPNLPILPSVSDHQAKIGDNSRQTNQNEYHTESRLSPYPGSCKSRYPVPDEKVLWEEVYPEYGPVLYTCTTPMNVGQYQDPIELPRVSLYGHHSSAVSFNTYDKTYGVDRTSHLGEYRVTDGLPLNPRGRTGMTGRGNLRRWGPNHAIVLLLTRWKVNDKGNKVLVNNKPLVEFVAVPKSENTTWALPAAFYTPGQRISDAFLRKDITGIIQSLVNDKEKEKFIPKTISKVLEMGTELFRGYADDPRNTDNAWMENRVIYFHDEGHSILKDLIPTVSDTVGEVAFHTLTSSSSLSGCNLYLCQLLAAKLGAYF